MWCTASGPGDLAGFNNDNFLYTMSSVILNGESRKLKLIRLLRTMYMIIRLKLNGVYTIPVDIWSLHPIEVMGIIAKKKTNTTTRHCA